MPIHTLTLIHFLMDASAHPPTHLPSYTLPHQSHSDWICLTYWVPITGYCEERVLWLKTNQQKTHPMKYFHVNDAEVRALEEKIFAQRPTESAAHAFFSRNLLKGLENFDCTFYTRS